MERHKLILTVLILALLFSASVGMIYYLESLKPTSNIVIKTTYRNRYINATGQLAIVSLQVYWNADGTDAITFLDWGFMEPGGCYDRTVYVKNEGNVPINVSVCSIDWIPENASQFINFNCDTEYNIAPNEIRQTLFVLNIASNVQNITTFNFTILVVGEG